MTRPLATAPSPPQRTAGSRADGLSNRSSGARSATSASRSPRRVASGPPRTRARRPRGSLPSQLPSVTETSRTARPSSWAPATPAVATTGERTTSATSSQRRGGVSASHARACRASPRTSVASTRTAATTSTSAAVAPSRGEVLPRVNATIAARATRVAPGSSTSGSPSALAQATTRIGSRRSWRGTSLPCASLAPLDLSANSLVLVGRWLAVARARHGAATASAEVFGAGRRRGRPFLEPSSAAGGQFA